MARSISRGSIVAVGQDQISCQLGDEVTILNLINGVYYSLHAVGAHIWQRLQEPSIVADIRDLLLQEYEVDASDCERDLLALLESLAAEGLIEVKDGPSL
jgi:Coenzyme PQQ synthesis protein D (PqqD)